MIDQNSIVKITSSALYDIDKYKYQEKRKLEIENDIIKLDNKVLPGIIQSIKVNQELMIDETDIPGKSGRGKQIKGFSDAVISISILLIDLKEDGRITKSKYEQLKTIEEAFKKIDSKGNVTVYSIVNRHTSSRNVKKCLFRKLDTSETQSSISVEIDFVEYEPVIQKVTEQKKTKTTTKTNTNKKMSPVDYSKEKNNWKKYSIKK